jgi:uncharacterized membrane protein YtjA (UPF0391 family)
MFKYAVIFLIISLIAGALGLTKVSQIAKRVSMVLFALFFLAFLALLGFAYLVSDAIDRPAFAPAAALPFMHKLRVNERSSPARVATLMCH